MTVLVLGVGGNVSQGILKGLALSGLSCRVVGACISPLSLGLYTVDRAYVSPRADDPAFLDWLLTVCRTDGVRAVLSGVEPVLAVLARHANLIREQTGAVCIVSAPECLAIGDDKLLTCKWLKEHGFNFPRYADAQNRDDVETLVKECGYPLIAKPRAGKGAHGLLQIHNQEDLAFIAGQSGYVIQEYLGDSESEYTAGCFCDCEGGVRGTIVMRRDLLEGTTHRAEVGQFPRLRTEAARIAAALRPMGSCNVQMRVSNGRPVCFEINVRFSGTTPIRSRLGFNEVEAAIRHYVLGEPAWDLPEVTQGIALRYWNEMYVEPEAADRLKQSKRLDNPKEYRLLVEDYGMRSS